MSPDRADGLVPLPVVVAGATEPIPVVVTGPPVKPGAAQNQALDPSLPARTTYQDDLTTAGQRRVNLIWEHTQAAIAIAVVLTTMVGSVYSMVRAVEIPNLMAVAFGTVVGFYFSRTNHAAIGGIGKKAPQGEYTGR